jgi:hypothetical protein
MSDRSDLNEAEVEKLIKRNVKSRKETWTQISFWDKYRMFNKWSIVSAIGNLLTIFGSMFYLLNDWFPFYQAEHFLGFGCFLTWISVTRYYAHTKDYFLI